MNRSAPVMFLLISDIRYRMIFNSTSPVVGFQTTIFRLGCEQHLIRNEYLDRMINIGPDIDTNFEEASKLECWNNGIGGCSCALSRVPHSALPRIYRATPPPRGRVTMLRNSRRRFLSTVPRMSSRQNRSALIPKGISTTCFASTLSHLDSDRSSA